MPAWKPLLEGDVATLAQEAVEAIAQALLRNDCEPCDHASLASGHLGVAMFLGYLAVAREDESLAEAAADRLSAGLRAAGEGALDLGLLTGLAGVCWGSHHLCDLLTGEVETEATRSTDESLIRLVETSPWQGSFDLVYGLSGIACYAVDHPDRDQGRRLIRAVIDRLEELAVRERGGLTWRSPREKLSVERQAFCPPEGYTDLGVAHGIAGVVGALSRVCASGFETLRARRLLDGAVEWLFHSKRRASPGSTFPSFSWSEESSRSAWCYGDPGIASVLLLAALATGEAAWKKEALAIARRDCLRPLAETQVADAELCHGAAGLGHLYNRMYQATGEDGFAQAARRWMERALSMRRPSASAGGFLNLWPGTEEWHPEAGLLVGAAGIGLCLLAAATDLEPSWDRALLLSLGS